MITRMKKLSLLVYHGEKDHVLTSLQGLGVVHLTEKADATSGDLQQLSSQVKSCERVINALVKIRHDQKITTPQKSGRPASTVMQSYDELTRTREKAEQTIATLQKDRAVVEPWGDFDPQTLAKLREAGIRTRFFQVAERSFSSIAKLEVAHEVITRRNGQVFFIILEEAAQPPAEIPADEVRMPDISLSGADGQIQSMVAKRDECDQALRDLTAYINDVIDYCKGLEDQLKLESARLGLEEHAEGTVLHLSGWVPAERCKGVEEFLNTLPVWYALSDPQPDDAVPVLLKNRPVPKLFEPIVKLYSLPDYRELDTTPFVAPFFAFFFGLCMGDIGYGLIVTIGGLIALTKVPPSMKLLMKLVVTLGLATTVSGLLLNSFFGMNLLGGPGVENPLFSSGAPYFAPLSPLKIGGETIFPAMSFALLVGFVQVILGIILVSGVLSRINCGRFAFELVAPRHVHCGEPFPVEVWARNLSRRLPLYSMAVSVELTDRRTRSGGQVSAFILQILPGLAERRTLRLTAWGRGDHQIHATRAPSQFPFGLLGRESLTRETRNLLVLPRLIPVDLSFLPIAPAGGRQTALRRGPGSDLFALREFREGDQPRHIHWRLTAKTGRRIVREFSAEEDNVVTLVLDPRGAGPDDEALELAISVAASCALEWHRRGVAVGLWTPETQIAPGHTRKRLWAIWTTLARLSPEPTGPVAPYPQPTSLAGSLLFIQWGKVPVPPGMIPLPTARAARLRQGNSA